MEQVAFGPFVLYPGSGRLLRDGAPVPVGQRARAVLATLAETPGRTVSKKDIRGGQPAKDPGRIEPILEGLRLAGLPEE